MTTERTRAGERIGDLYTVDKLIARGGFSSVYRGTRLSDQSQVAIKILELDGKVEANWIERFAREARLISQLKHPSTIRILDFGQASRFLYIVMEFVKGRSLSRQIKKFGALQPLETAKVAREILLSLEEAHGLGILHRDMKPSNIMLGRDKDENLYVKVLDFGVAKILDPSPEVDIALTQIGAFVGTPRYASPEQMRREELTVSSDVYGVGMVMWECLVGDPAVPGVDFQSAVAGHLGPSAWRLPGSIECPPGLSHVLYKSLEKNPEHRYQSCEEMRRDIERFLDDEFVQEFPTMEADHLGEFEEISDPILSEFEADLWFSEDEVPLLQPTRKSDASAPLKSVPEIDAGEPEVEPPLELSFDPRRQGDRHQQLGDRAYTKARKSFPVGIAMAAVILLLIVGAGVFWMSYEAPDEVVVVVEPTEQQAKPIPADLLVLAIRTGGWSPGKLDKASYNDVSRTSFKADKDRRSVFVTIYECESDQLALALEKDVSFPEEAVRLGRTVVKVAPTKEDLLPVNGMVELLKAFEEVLKKDGHL